MLVTVFRRLLRCILPSVLAGIEPGCVPVGMGANGGSLETRDVTLKFAAVVGDEAAACGTSYPGLGSTGETCEILDLRFYVSNVRLVDANGGEAPMTLDQDGKWQVDDVALLDFENGTGKCSDGGTVDVNAAVTGTIPVGAYNGVQFDLGVPFELNHDDLAAAPAPLNLSAMFWTWAIGHKFLRVDLETEGGLRWNMHLGSTMCESNGPADPPAVECTRPNRPVIALDVFDPDADTIVLDLRELFASSDLTQDTPDTASGCQTFPNDVNECMHLFPNLGLDFTTGKCIDGCANQRVFRAAAGDLPVEDSAAAVARGQLTFTTEHATAGGTTNACADCHDRDGSGLIGPDIRSSSAQHLRQHAQGDGPHPDGVKFIGLTAEDFASIEIYLTSLCAEDPGCMSDPSDEHDHDGAEEEVHEAAEIDAGDDRSDQEGGTTE